MKQLNVAISEEAYDAAKVAAEERGMLLRKWVERVILEASSKSAGKSDLRYTPLENE